MSAGSASSSTGLSDRDGSLAPVARTLTLGPATAAVVANMIGTGIFTTTGFLIAALGDPKLVLLAWLVGGVIALSGALTYAELGAMLPRGGGECVYLSRAFHPAMGCVSGVVSMTVGFAAPLAASAIAFGTYARAVFPSVPVREVGAALLLATAGLHLFDTRRGGARQAVLTSFKVLLILVFIVGAFVAGHGSWSHFAGASVRPASAPGLAGAFAVELVFVSYSYSGWNAAAYLAGEIVNPARFVPRALLFGTAFVTCVYVALNVVYFFAAPPAALAGHVAIAHDAAMALFGERAGRALSALVCVVLVSSVSSMMMAGPRVAVFLAEAGFLPSVLARRTRNGAPTVAVALQTMFALAILVTATFDRILYATGFLLSLMAAATVLGSLVLRVREPGLTRPFRAPFGRVAAAVFLALSTWMAIDAIFMRPQEALAGLLVIAAGVVLYVARRGKLARP